jgi:hypothetical protein
MKSKQINNNKKYWERKNNNKKNMVIYTINNKIVNKLGININVDKCNYKKEFNNYNNN